MAKSRNWDSFHREERLQNTTPVEQYKSDGLTHDEREARSARNTAAREKREGKTPTRSSNGWWGQR